MPDTSTAVPREAVGPLGDGADPFVARHAGRYYWVSSGGWRPGIYISVSDTLFERGTRTCVWTPPKHGPYSKQVWAPELHRFKNHWYIIFAASDGDNVTHRAYALKSRTLDPLSQYDFIGQIYTGDNYTADKTEQQSPCRWAIDMTLFTHKDQLYAIWSGWESNEDLQYLYIVPMSDPTTPSGPRVKICNNSDYDWERVDPVSDPRGLNEGASALTTPSGRVFVTYSCCAAWLSGYKTGLLELTGENPLDPNSWKKYPQPFLQSTGVLFGPGHGMFQQDADGKTWFVFHVKKKPEPDWAREIWLAPVHFDQNGFPTLMP